MSFSQARGGRPGSRMQAAAGAATPTVDEKLQRQGNDRWRMASCPGGASPWVIVVVAALGLAFLLAEGAAVVVHGTQGIALIAVLVAATVSSIAGFAFSALCSALLFHLMDNAIYTVQVMIICSVAIQLLSVATFWRSIDWFSLPVFLAGGVLGVPAGVYLLLHLQAGTYRDIIGSLLIAYGGYLLLRRPLRPLQLGPLSDACAGFPGASITI